MLVVGLEGRHAEVENFQPPDGAVNRAWWNQDRRARLKAKRAAVELDHTFSRQHHVDLRVTPVEVSQRLAVNRHPVDTGHVVPRDKKGPARLATGASHRGQIVAPGHPGHLPPSGT